jgi:hypothetical protein
MIAETGQAGITSSPDPETRAAEVPGGRAGARQTVDVRRGGPTESDNTTAVAAAPDLEALTRCAPPERYPAVALEHLDALWIQVAGTLCNLRCTHCFVSCGPGDDRHPFMTRDEVQGRVAEALPRGARVLLPAAGRSSTR